MKILSMFLLLVVVSNALADSGGPVGLTIYPHAGITYDNILGDQETKGLGIGYRMDSFSIELNYEKAPDAKDSDLRSDVDFRTYRVDAIYHFQSDTKWEPYLSLGIGTFDYHYDDVDDDDSEHLSFGFGVIRPIKGNLHWRADARIFRDDQDKKLNPAFSVGLHHIFGDRPAAPVQPVAALDVPDPGPCPDTPAGVDVDAEGCPLDDDGDGVPNYKDQCPNTTNRKAEIDELGCYVMLESSVSITLLVEFDFDDARPQPGYEPEVQKVAEFMEKYPQTRASIEGHTDSRGSDEYNQNLSERRAKSITQILINEFGIAEDRVTPVGFGESQPTASDDTDEGHQRNRRVTAVLTATEQIIKERD